MDMHNTFRVLVLSLALPALLSACNHEAAISSATPATPGILKFTTEYQAVFMQNGQVFFGKLEQAGTAFPVLRNVYYIRNQINPETKATNSVLLKRSSELHGPDVMYINAQQIALIEPVSSTSRVGQLLAQAQGSVLPAPAPAIEPKP